jgi:hypothetical protein
MYRARILTAVLGYVLASFILLAEAEDRLQLIQEFRTGIHINGVIESASQLPTNLPFYRLLSKQKDIARTWYIGLTQTDEPPYPMNGPEFLFTQLRYSAQKLNIKGEIALEVIVSANGHANEVKLIRTPSKDLGRYAISAALRQQYSPGLCQSLPCEMSYPVAIRID